MANQGMLSVKVNSKSYNLKDEWDLMREVRTWEKRKNIKVSLSTTACYGRENIDLTRDEKAWSTDKSCRWERSSDWKFYDAFNKVYFFFFWSFHNWFGVWVRE